MPHPSECTQYYVCLEPPSPPILSNCGAGQEFDYIDSVCKPEAEAQCYGLCDPCQVYCVEEGRIPDPLDCTRYLYCVPPDDTVHFSCEEGFGYDTASKECIDLSGGTCEPLCDSGGSGEGIWADGE